MIENRETTPWRNVSLFLLVLSVFLLPGRAVSAAGSLTLPAKTWGICFGNSPRFNGLRFNIADEKLELINGVNITLWKANDKDNKEAGGTVNGLSLGVIPYAGELNGILDRGSHLRGRCVAIGDGFLWLYDDTLDWSTASFQPLQPVFVGLESLRVLKQAAWHCGLADSQVEDIFYNNARRLLAP